ncbi:MAG: Rdx family protein [Archangium sp.]|nr:Rdx family protein [Archangium sp.]MDP3155482.1 Rdx family protein [Archangium sp.]MDP3573814.1 Rdx family protein [Archangium sp.]
MARAARAADALKEELELEAEFIRGSGGIFEVAVDGRVVAKKEMGRFPTEKDVVDAVSAAMGV